MLREARRFTGFTLIELMLVVAIIGLLSAIALPKFANLVVKAKEASIKGKLGSLRSALSIYYVDNESRYLAGGTLVLLNLTPKYLDDIPALTHTYFLTHGTSNGNATGGAGWDSFWTTRDQPWMYFPLTGQLHVNCTHTDSNGQTWSLW